MSAAILSALPDPRPIAAQFVAARPFRHVVIEGFFPADFASALLQDFPPFERGNARNEHGGLGGKSTVERIRELGPPFAALDDLVQSPGFLRWLSAATGIPDLLYDPHYFGGGTHDNRDGQELDPHVDFNRHPETGWHRRLNLIVYLNPGWQDGWGGLLELHSDPRRSDDAVTHIAPLFNRCVVFETTEWSWHGFGRIVLPPDLPSTTRRSIALYFYTRERPAEELAPEHSTIYVDRPLPERFRAGLTLSERDVEELQILLARRDQHNQRLYGELMQLSASRPRGPSGTLPGLFVDSLLGLARYGFSRRGADERQALKQAVQPFVTRLPPPLRERLRARWRRWDAPTG
jgi:hypothetical protein